MKTWSGFWSLFKTYVWLPTPSQKLALAKGKVLSPTTAQQQHSPGGVTLLPLLIYNTIMGPWFSATNRGKTKRNTQIIIDGMYIFTVFWLKVYKVVYRGGKIKVVFKCIENGSPTIAPELYYLLVKILGQCFSNWGSWGNFMSGAQHLRNLKYKAKIAGNKYVPCRYICVPQNASNVCPCMPQNLKSLIRQQRLDQGCLTF